MIRLSWILGVSLPSIGLLSLFFHWHEPGDARPIIFIIIGVFFWIVFAINYKSSQKQKSSLQKVKSTFGESENLAVRAKIWSIIAPDSLELGSPQAIVNFGETAVPAIIALFENPRDPDTGNVGNQALLAAALVSFAKRGNDQATSFLRRIADNQVMLYNVYGQSAFKMSQDFIKKPRPNTTTE